MIFSIPWLAFTSFILYRWYLELGRGENKSPMIYVPLLVLVPFILIGIKLFLSPITAARKAQKTFYAVTNKKAITCEVNFFGTKNVTSFTPDRLISMSRREKKDGSGDLIFEEFTTQVVSGTNTVRRGFMMIPNVREAEDAIRQALWPGEKTSESTGSNLG